MSTVKQAIPGKYFDVDLPLSGGDAIEFAKTYLGGIRYIPRTSALGEGDLTALEVSILLSANLAVGVVQHCPEDNWIPSAELGSSYGTYAGVYLNEIGFPKGTSVFLDLEMVSTTATDIQVIEYSKSWYKAVSEAGYIPGVYVGYQTGLRDQQLWDLPFQHYWKAYNCDQDIPKRGYQIVQELQQALPNSYIDYDPNRVQADNLGGLPIFLFP